MCLPRGHDATDWPSRGEETSERSSLISGLAERTIDNIEPHEKKRI